jgi:hypothetical protein
MNKDDIIRMAREAEIPGAWDLNWFDPYLERFASLVAAHEREACAKVANKYAEGLERNYSEIIADEIQARGQA